MNIRYVKILAPALCLVALYCLIPQANAACANQCSGHGTCGSYDKCTCYDNWMDGDCSARVCPYEKAWVDTANDNDDAHHYAECANKGVCDRETGQCVCFAGYTGKGCERMRCPSDCSGHGTCEFIEELAKNDWDQRVDGDSLRTYTLWDQEKITGCKCDAGYTGPACATRTCAVGDDPLTVVTSDGLSQSSMVQGLKIGGTGTVSGEFVLTYFDPYGGAWTTQAITFSGTDSTCATNVQSALRALPNNVLSGVTVSAAASFYPFTRTTGVDVSLVGTGTTGAIVSDTATHCTVTVTFPNKPGTSGLQHLLHVDYSARGAGYHPQSSGMTSSNDDLATTIAEASTSSSATKVPLYEGLECAGRGKCDTEVGECVCFSGFRGKACEKQEVLV